jgi:CPA2 family monovalent cation:H+ antiporter-2
MGPVIASIHEKRDRIRHQIKKDGNLAVEPKLKSSALETDAAVDVKLSPQE